MNSYNFYLSSSNKVFCCCYCNCHLFRTYYKINSLFRFVFTLQIRWILINLIYQTKKYYVYYIFLDFTIPNVWSPYEATVGIGNKETREINSLLKNTMKKSKREQRNETTATNKIFLPWCFWDTRPARFNTDPVSSPDTSHVIPRYAWLSFYAGMLPTRASSSMKV